MVIGQAKRLVRIFVLAALVGSVTLVVAGSAQGAPGAVPTSRWRLVSNAQSACFSPRVHDAYYGVWIAGSWTRAINVGASGLPPGTSFDTSYAPIASGLEHGRLLARVRAREGHDEPTRRHVHRVHVGNRRQDHEVGAAHPEREDEVRLLTRPIERSSRFTPRRRAEGRARRTRSLRGPP